MHLVPSTDCPYVSPSLSRKVEADNRVAVSTTCILSALSIDIKSIDISFPNTKFFPLVEKF